MNDLTIFPDRLTTMSDADLAALPVEQLYEVHVNLAQLVDWVRKAQAKTHAALQRRYTEREREARLNLQKFDAGLQAQLEGYLLSLGILAPGQTLTAQDSPPTAELAEPVLEH